LRCSATLVRVSEATPSQSGRGITLRVVLLGLLGVAAVNAAVPWNDYAIYNTFLVGSYLPTVIVLFLFALLLFVNAPLYRFAPQHAFSPRELSILLLMWLVGCAIPSQGMLRGLIPLLVSNHFHGQSSVQFWSAFKAMGLPEYLFPVPINDRAMTDPVVTQFIGRAPPDVAVPYSAWVRPLAIWSMLAACILSLLFGLAAILREHWSRAERLPFPLAELQLRLIEPPAPGRAFNALFRSTGFWVALIAVFVIHASEGFNAYWPKYAPEIPSRFDLQKLLADSPLRFLPIEARAARLTFLFVGAMYFVPLRVIFSIWFCYLLIAAFGVINGVTTGSEVPWQTWQDAHTGGAVIWVLLMLWLARKHWAMVFRHLIGKRSPDDDPRVPSLRGPAVAVLVGFLGAMLWLTVLAGVSVPIALLILACLVVAHVITARVVAETGVPIMRSIPHPMQALILFPATSISSRDLLFAGYGSSLGAYTSRESAMVFAQNGQQLVARAHETPPRWSTLFVLMALSVGVAFCVGSVSSLTAYYRVDVPMTSTVSDTVINKDGVQDKPKSWWIDPVAAHARGQYAARSDTPWVNLTVGGTVVGGLQFAATRFGGWPIPPVGFLVATSPYGGWLWFSALVCWALKGSIVRLGGASLYRSAQPIFIGMIFGAVLATGFWIMFNVVRLLMHEPIVPVRFMPV
jgi:hypothetical protein